MDNQLIPLNIVIGDRNYRIKISPGDEETVRRTLKIINEKIVEFRGLYAGKDMQDYIAMVLIWYATQPRAAEDGYEKDQLMRALRELEDQLNSFGD